MSIPLKFSLFWAGSNLSYLRYLTFKSLRHFHPDSEIQLYISDGYDKNVHKWGGESQDFESPQDGPNYLDHMSDLGIVVKHVEYVISSKICPILQADVFRWAWLRDNGGFYLDTDQIVTKSFSTLPLESEFIYSRYIECQCGDYCPVGVLGMEKGSPISETAIQTVMKSYRHNSYNSSGPFMMRNMLREVDLSRSFNAPSDYFYPIDSSSKVDQIYSGTFSIPSDSFALHWFGGHPISQQFNKQYTEELSKTSDDTISKTIREIGII